ncbi:MAG: hypothetical protein ACK5T7_14370, partial [Gemmatimonas sp.]
MPAPARPAHADRTWTVQPDAAAVVRRALDDRLARVPGCAAFAARLLDDIGVRLLDILDFVAVVDHAEAAAFRAAGWVAEGAHPEVLRNPTGLFPAVLTGAERAGLGFKVEYVHEFLTAQGLAVPVDGALHAPFRRVLAWSADGVECWAIER